MKDFFCVSILGKQHIVQKDKVFCVKISGKSNDRFKKDEILEGKSIYSSSSESPEILKFKILHLKLEKGVAFKKKRRKRYQKKIGYRKTVLTLKGIF